MADAPGEGQGEEHVAADLEFRGVSKHYPGQDEPAIEDLSLTVSAGEICVLVGPSGCGKTTAMRLVNRMIEPSGGDILIDGVSVKDRSPSELRRHIGYAIQQVGLFPHASVAENIGTVPRLLGWDKQRISKRVDELLELVSLDPSQTRDRFPAQLSGGQRQRVGVARALAVDPPLLLMDEPFGAIDPINRERLQNEFLRLQGQIRKTVVFVTHDIDEAIKMGDRIAILREGAVLAQYDTPDRILTDPADEFVADFVGRGALIKRLSLTRASEVQVERWDTVTAGTDADTMMTALRRADRDYLVLVDAEQRPLGWLPRDARPSDTEVLRRGLPILDPIGPQDSLYDALDRMLGSNSSAALLVDDQGRYRGVLSMDTLQLLMHTDTGTGRAAVTGTTAEGDEAAEGNGGRHRAGR